MCVLCVHMCMSVSVYVCEYVCVNVRAAGGCYYDHISSVPVLELKTDFFTRADPRLGETWTARFTGTPLIQRPVLVSLILYVYNEGEGEMEVRTSQRDSIEEVYGFTPEVRGNVLHSANFTRGGGASSPLCQFHQRGEGGGASSPLCQFHQRGGGGGSFISTLPISPEGGGASSPLCQFHQRGGGGGGASSPLCQFHQRKGLIILSPPVVLRVQSSL